MNWKTREIRTTYEKNKYEYEYLTLKICKEFYPLKIVKNINSWKLLLTDLRTKKCVLLTDLLTYGQSDSYDVQDGQILFTVKGSNVCYSSEFCYLIYVEYIISIITRKDAKKKFFLVARPLRGKGGG